MNATAFIMIGLTLLGVLSPLLTFTALFQLKEWRLDRLIEHLRREGWINQLFGRIRPVLALLFFFVKDPLYWLLPFAMLTAAQWILGRQRKPVWTSKAKLLVILSIALTTLITFIAPLTPLIILLQPLFVLFAWLLFHPLDTLLKHHIFKQARDLREAHPEWIVIGIAGSVGKTTTKELLAHLLQDVHPLATPAHVNTEMGVAKWLVAVSGKRLATSTSILIVEMGAYRKGEIALMCQFVQPTIGIVTALGSDHLALFGSEAAIIEANGELLESLPKNGKAFLSSDNEGCRILATRHPNSIIVPQAENIKEDEFGLHFSLTAYRYSLPLHGLHNINNAALAITVARHLGITDNRIAELLKNFHPLAHTFNVREENGITLVDDTYNSSRLSLRAAIDWAAGRSERPRILLTSGLMEVGKAEDRLMHEIGTHAKGKIERVIFTTASGLRAFEEGFGGKTELLTSNEQRATKGSLLLAIGRMPLSAIQQLLPTVSP